MWTTKWLWSPYTTQEDTPTQPEVLPFGISNAPASFRNMLQAIGVEVDQSFEEEDS